MPTQALTADSFEKTVTGGGIVLVDLWADWCGPCKQFAPVYEKASDKHEDIVFGKVDTEAEQQLSAALGISSIPTVMAFRDGILLHSQAGALPPAMLEDLISQIRELDMDEVRKKVAEQQAAEGEGQQA
ncbi:thioredoxin [Dermacoccaceae bacterium W4C1]